MQMARSSFELAVAAKTECCSLLAIEACFAQIQFMLDFAEQVVYYATTIAKLKWSRLVGLQSQSIR